QGRSDRVVGQDARIDGRNGEPRDLAAPARLVEWKNRRGKDSQRESGFADGAPRRLAGVALGEDGAPYETVDDLGPKTARVGQRNRVSLRGFRAREKVVEIGGSRQQFHRDPPTGGDSIGRRSWDVGRRW